MGDIRRGPLERPVRGVRVESRQVMGLCMPLYGMVEVDFEPVPEGVAASCELACELPEDASLATGLIRGVLRELAGEYDSDERHRPGGAVAVRAVVRTLSYSLGDSWEPVFVRLGTLAVREALECAAEGRDPRYSRLRLRMRTGQDGLVFR
ncbi:hypothetical protein [Streptomyces sp. NPDC050504]|uniref:hypothetical protein n=1 Tax=Streptomyces sp. NPDC050504 TaxID=3365618 RepID=UPI003787A700